ncbi:hypothetical protein F5Y08DRAFT_338872 [Xylaria arbuscula]|nr:hypothetical protein F5Y08DRAFT_338872 [Xylaria arbuscula]
MIAFRVLVLGLYLLLGQTYPPEIRAVGGERPETYRLPNDVRHDAITNTGGLTTQVAQITQTTTVMKYMSGPTLTFTAVISDEPASHDLQSSETEPVKEPTSQVVPPLEATVIEEPTSSVKKPIEVTDIEESRSIGKSSGPQDVKEPTSQIVPPSETAGLTASITRETEDVIKDTHEHEHEKKIGDEVGNLKQDVDQDVQSHKVHLDHESREYEELVTRLQKYPEAEVREEPVSQVRPDGLDPDTILYGCNFMMIRLTSEQLQPPYDVADTVKVNTVYKRAAEHLAEIATLLRDNWQTLVDSHGYPEVVRLHDSLIEWVEKPLKHGCATVENLQATLVSLVDNRKKSRSVRKALLLDALRKYEAELSEHLANEDLKFGVPSWSHLEPVLQSDKCHKGDCFSVGRHPLDLVTAEMPHRLRSAIQHLQDSLNPGTLQMAKIVALRTWWLLLWWLSLFRVVLSKEFLITACLTVFFSTVYRLIKAGYPNIEFSRMGTRS